MRWTVFVHVQNGLEWLCTNPLWITIFRSRCTRILVSKKLLFVFGRSRYYGDEASRIRDARLLFAPELRGLCDLQPPLTSDPVGRDLRRQRLPRGAASSGKRRGLRLGQKTEGHAETFTAPPLSHRASDWSLETRPPDETKLSARQKRRLHQRAVGELRLQPKKTHASFLLALFRLG